MENLDNKNDLINKIRELNREFRFILTLQVRDFTQKIAVTGKPFLTLTLGDKTGTISNVKKFMDNASQLESIREKFESGNIIKFQGKFDPKWGCSIETEQLLESDQYDIDDFYDNPEINTEELMEVIQETINNIQNDKLKDLLNNILSDESIKEKYITAPSSIKYHHSYRSGNLEHTVGMISVMKELVRFYSGDTQLDLDLLYAGIILHDIGKIYEYSIDKGFPTINSDYALLGHHSIGSELVSEYIENIDSFPKDLENRLRHLILSHHGKLEWDSPIEPQTNEALILHYLDMIDSRFKYFE